MKHEESDFDRGSGFVMEIWIILIIILFFVWRAFSTRGISKIPTAERKKDVFKLSKEEYVNKYNNGTHASKINLESEWESENKIKEQM